MKAGAGRNHTAVVSDEGKSFAFGWNKHGQLGLGSARNGVENCIFTVVNGMKSVSYMLCFL